MVKINAINVRCVEDISSLGVSKLPIIIGSEKRSDFPSHRIPDLRWFCQRPTFASPMCDTFWTGVPRCLKT